VNFLFDVGAAVLSRIPFPIAREDTRHYTSALPALAVRFFSLALDVGRSTLNVF
jgi:hypothetical protein